MPLRTRSVSSALCRVVDSSVRKRRQRVAAVQRKNDFFMPSETPAAIDLFKQHSSPTRMRALTPTPRFLFPPPIASYSNMASPILVTGGAGYIGSHTVRALAAQGRKIVVLDNMVFGHHEAIVDDSVELVVGDVQR